MPHNSSLSTCLFSSQLLTFSLELGSSFFNKCFSTFELLSAAIFGNAPIFFPWIVLPSICLAQFEASSLFENTAMALPLSSCRFIDTGRLDSVTLLLEKSLILEDPETESETLSVSSFNISSEGSSSSRVGMFSIITFLTTLFSCTAFFLDILAYTSFGSPC